MMINISAHRPSNRVSTASHMIYILHAVSIRVACWIRKEPPQYQIRMETHTVKNTTLVNYFFAKKHYQERTNSLIKEIKITKEYET